MPDLTLQDYAAIVWRRRGLVLITVAVAVLGTAAWSMAQTPLYRADAELLVRSTPSEQVLGDASGMRVQEEDAARQLNNELQLLESDLVRDLVAEDYDGPLDVDRVSAKVRSEENNVIRVSASAAEPEAAADLVNVYVDRYGSVRQQSQTEDLLSTGAEIQAELDAVRQEITEVRAPLEEVEQQRVDASAAARDDLDRQLADIEGEISPRLAALSSRETFYLDQLDRVQLTANLARSTGLEVLSAAQPPEEPFSPNIPRNLALALAAGMLVALALALVRHHLDDSIATEEQAAALTGLPTLGVIPRFGPSRDGEPGLISVEDPTSPAAEAYRSLRTSVKFLGVDRPARVVQVTSGSAGEGKTLTAANLAVVLAKAGDRVLLVEADLRRSRMHHLLDTPRTPGLTNLLLEDASIGAAVCTVDEVPNLHLLPAGDLPPNPSELLAGGRARSLLETLRSTYDVILLDSPPVLPVTDAQVLARWADITLVVVASRTTSKRALGRTFDRLAQVEAPVAGTVQNVAVTSGRYADTYYNYESRPSPEENLTPMVGWWPGASDPEADERALHVAPLNSTSDAARGDARETTIAVGDATESPANAN